MIHNKFKMLSVSGPNANVSEDYNKA